MDETVNFNSATRGSHFGHKLESNQRAVTVVVFYCLPRLGASRRSHFLFLPEGKAWLVEKESQNALCLSSSFPIWNSTVLIHLFSILLFRYPTLIFHLFAEEELGGDPNFWHFSLLLPVIQKQRNRELGEIISHFFFFFEENLNSLFCFS